jgi:hypothetical protein
MDDAMRDYLRSIDSSLHRLVDEGGVERRQFAEDLRNELRLLTRTLAGRAGGSS